MIVSPPATVSNHPRSRSLQQWLAAAHPVWFILYAGTAGFCAYFSMYAFRKPFTAATFDNVAGWDFALDYKIALVMAQVLGYALSKFVGIRFIAEMPRSRRAPMIVGLIAAAWAALIAFALLPAPYNVIALFFNGLPLGLIWGLVFAWLEGRRTSEVLGALLCSSFIVSTGVVKSAGACLMTTYGVSAFWMPAATGALFFPLLALSTLGLSQLPPPGVQDEMERTRRAPMNRAQRHQFCRAHAPGLLALVLGYVLFTAFRDFRDNFSAEIWLALGYSNPGMMFTASEAPIAVLALCGLGVIMLIRDNKRALRLIHGLIVGGAALIGASTLAFTAGLLTPLTWMVLSGAGLYLAYTPFNAMLFDRMIASTQTVGTAGFLIYIADASGYAASVGLLLYRNLAAPEIAWLQFFVMCAYATSIGGLVLVGLSAVYFRGRGRFAGALAAPAA